MKLTCWNLLLILVFHRGRSDIFKETIPSGVFPDDYDKYQPPWNPGHPSHVYLQLNVMDVDKIDDGAMEFSIQSYLSEYWKDSRLNLGYFLPDKNMTAMFPTYLIKHIWVPDLVFDNVRNGVVFDMPVPNTILKVTKDRTFYRSTRYNMLIGCMMDFHYYPMDTQECCIKITTMANPDYKVHLHWAEEFQERKLQSILFKNNIQPLQYVLNKPKSYENTEIWTSGNYTYLYANFTFVRRISGSIFKVYVPSTLVVFLSWISFWLGIRAVPARITLGVTSLLTLGTQIVQAHYNLPPISYMTAMDVWLLTCMITVFSSILEYAFAYQILILKKQRALNDSHHIIVATSKVGMESLRSRQREISSFQGRNLTRNDSLLSNKSLGTTNSEIFLDKTCRKLFPFLFFTFTTVYWSYYLSLNK